MLVRAGKSLAENIFSVTYGSDPSSGRQSGATSSSKTLTSNGETSAYIPEEDDWFGEMPAAASGANDMNDDWVAQQGNNVL